MDQTPKKAYCYKLEQRFKDAMAKTKRKTMIVCAIIMALVALAACALSYLVMLNENLTRGDKSAEEIAAIDDMLMATPAICEEPFYMLLIGSDARIGQTESSRSDTNIVVRVDPVAYTLTLVSIPRDTKVTLPNGTIGKFNAAYAYDGAAGAIKAADELLDIEISHYAEVHFEDLAALVDSMGGIDIYVEDTIDDFHTDDADGKHYVIEKGQRTLSGWEALAYARTRQYADGDFTRQSHQRLLVEELISKAIATPLPELPSLIERASKCVTTDLNLVDIIMLARHFAAAPDDITIYSAMLPSYSQWEDGVSYVINDAEKTEEMMDIVDAGEDPSGIKSEIVGHDVFSTISPEAEEAAEIPATEDIPWVQPTRPTTDTENSDAREDDQDSAGSQEPSREVEPSQSASSGSDTTGIDTGMDVVPRLRYGLDSEQPSDA